MYYFASTEAVGCEHLPNQQWSGIDLYRNTYLHEKHHVEQIADADSHLNSKVGDN